MAKVSNEAVEKFGKCLNEIMHRIGGGKVGVNTTALRKLVHEDRGTAVRVVEIYCAMAQSNPALFQGALLIAAAYQVEFKDTSLVEMVQDQAKTAGAEEWLREIDILKEMPMPGQEPPERVAAKEWWKSSGRQDGRCDNCYRPMKRGEGYLVHGPIFVMESDSGPISIDMGEEIICEECFRKTKGGKVWK